MSKLLCNVLKSSGGGQMPLLVVRLTWNEPLKIRCHVVVTQQRATVQQCTRKFCNLWICRRKYGHRWTASSSLHHTKTVKFLCCVSAIPVNKMLLQELHRLIGIKMLTSNFLEIFGCQSNFPGKKCHFLPLCGRSWKYGSSPQCLFENQMSLKKYQVIWQPYVQRSGDAQGDCLIVCSPTKF